MALKIDCNVQKSVDEVIFDLPREEQIIVNRLRALILESLPKAIEKNSFGIPLYVRRRMICFIWPASIFWGPKRTLETQQAKGTALGFCQGNLMSNEDGVLLAEGRKQVFSMYFHSVKEINDDQIRALLYEADLIDESFGRNRSKKQGVRGKK